MHKIAAGIDQKKMSGSCLVIGYWFLAHKSDEAMQHCFETQTTSSNSNHELLSRLNMLGIRNIRCSTITKL